MTSTLMIIQIILAILITIAILLQKSDSIGLGAYSGSNESLFGAKGPTGFLAKATFTLALLFVINTLALGYLYNKQSSRSVVDTIKTETKSPIPTPVIPAPQEKAAGTSTAPAAPTNKTDKN
ncbi:preprotein translocase subunit SecG [Nitratifractor sp.]